MSGAQVLIIFVGGAAFSIASPKQTAGMWGIAILMGFLSIPVGMLIRCIPDAWLSAMIPGFLKRGASKVPGLKISDEEMGMYPEPLVDVRDELNFLKKMKGGRLNNLKFAIQHPKETIMQVSRSPSRSRSNSIQPPQTPSKGGGSEGGIVDLMGSGAATPDSRRRSKSVRSRSNSALGAPTVMAGIVAAGVAAGWSPVARTPSEARAEDNGGGSRLGSTEEREDDSIDPKSNKDEA